MPNSYDIDNELRADVPPGQTRSRDASLRAREKENSFAPALVSQEGSEATAGGGARGDTSLGGGARCRGSST